MTMTILFQSYDLLISIVLGAVLFVVIFYYNNNNNKPIIDKQDEQDTPSSSSAAAASSSSKEEEEDTKNETNEEKELRLKNKELLDKYLSEDNEEKLIKKTAFLQKKFGIGEDDIKRAIKDTRKDLLNKNHNLEDSLSIWKMVDWFIYLALFCGFCYFFNVSTNGDFGRVIAGLFPREIETLGLKKVLEQVKK
jgi:hypothetical protein